MDFEKNERIFQVAKELFATLGYHQTSANLIAETADVSKALIFHHFQSKKNLYLTIINDSINVLMDAFEKEWHPQDSEDFFEQLKFFVKMKLNVAVSCPVENQLLMQAFITPPKEIMKELEQLFLEKSKPMIALNDDYIYQLLTPNSLRDDVELNQAKRLIRTVFEGFSQRIINEYTGKFENLVDETDKILAEMDAIIDILKYGVSTREANQL